MKPGASATRVLVLASWFWRHRETRETRSPGCTNVALYVDTRSVFTEKTRGGQVVVAGGMFGGGVGECGWVDAVMLDRVLRGREMCQPEPKRPPLHPDAMAFYRNLESWNLKRYHVLSTAGVMSGVRILL